MVRAADLGRLLRASGDILGVPRRAGVNVRLTGDAEIRQLNVRFMGVDEPTDVLAFPAGEHGRVGDVAISVERAMAQSPDSPAELRLLAIHGLLHCLGHDHHDAPSAAVMVAAMRMLLRGQPVPDLGLSP